MQTELVINRGGFPPFSARGCQQTLQPIASGELRRTVNGELVYTGRKGHRKYASTITCTDLSSPAIEGIWRGETLTLHCIQRLWQEIFIEEDVQQITVQLERPAVENSITALTSNQTELTLREVFSSKLDITHHFRKGEKVYISYRPQLQMRVISFELETNEWQQSCGGRLILEEI